MYKLLTKFSLLALLLHSSSSVTALTPVPSSNIDSLIARAVNYGLNLEGRQDADSNSQLVARKIDDFWLSARDLVQSGRYHHARELPSVSDMQYITARSPAQLVDPKLEEIARGATTAGLHAKYIQYAKDRVEIVKLLQQIAADVNNGYHVNAKKVLGNLERYWKNVAAGVPKSVTTKTNTDKTREEMKKGTDPKGWAAKAAARVMRLKTIAQNKKDTKEYKDAVAADSAPVNPPKGQGAQAQNQAQNQDAGGA
ncbi:hypothetical protein CVT24_008111 [Panaeolus cyanescens]|uniref:Uncharacterized protein n=1 Tax=Panaeolus cyanescens TaxID=181874 RepID=A0A409YMW5_9AGAR|nr:hypothetical protein CVT24_008111 [Panaeolus cyanescens]